MTKELEALFLEIIQLQEEAKNKMETMRALRQDDMVDGRALSIAVTHLETSQLWVANSRK